MAVEIDANIYGLQATKRLMRELEPALLKEMNKEIRGQLKPVADRAKGLIPSAPPLSGWGRAVSNARSRPSYSPYGRRWDYARLEWNTAEARSGIKIRQGGGRTRGVAARAAWQLRSDSPAAAVFELMGRGKSDAAMVRNVARRFPSDGRVLYRAWDEIGSGNRIEPAVVGVIRDYEKAFQRRLDSAGGV